MSFEGHVYDDYYSKPNKKILQLHLFLFSIEIFLYILKKVRKNVMKMIFRIMIKT